MTLQQFASDPGLIYMNTGAAGLMPIRCKDALLSEIAHEFRYGRVGAVSKRRFFEALRRLRQQVAALVGVRGDDLAITGCTSDGANIVAWGLALAEGDEVLTTDFEHPGALAGFYTATRAARARMVHYSSENQAFDIDRFFSQVNHKTKLVLISHVSWIDGQILPVRDIAIRAREMNVKTFFDGAQAVGHIPVDLGAISCDFYTFPSQKWLMGPEGAGALYVNENSLANLRQTYAGVFSFNNGDAEFTQAAQGAGRFEIGTRFRPVLKAWSESITTLEEEIGWRNLFDSSRQKAGQLRERLSSAGFAIVKVPEPTCLVTIQLEHGLDPHKIVTFLEDRSIYVRSVPGRRIRASVAVHNTSEEIDTYVAALGKAREDPTCLS